MYTLNPLSVRSTLFCPGDLFHTPILILEMTMSDKYFIGIVTGLLFGFISTATHSGSVTAQPDFTSAQALTASDLNTRIQPLTTAINDNDQRITSNAAKLQKLTATSCSVGSVVQAISADGTLSCVNQASSSIGIAFAAGINTLAVNLAPSNLISVPLNAPANGYVFVTFSAEYQLNHTLGLDDLMNFDISNSATPQIDAATKRSVYIDPLAQTMWVAQSVAVQKVFQVSAGPATYHVYASSNKNPGPDSQNTVVLHPTIQAIFVPNMY